MIDDNRLSEVLKEALDLSESAVKAVQEAREEADIRLEKVAASEETISEAVKSIAEAGLLSDASAREKLAAAFKEHPNQILESVKVIANHYSELKNSRPSAHVEGRVIEKGASADEDTVSSWEQDGWIDVIRQGA